MAHIVEREAEPGRGEQHDQRRNQGRTADGPERCANLGRTHRPGSLLHRAAGDSAAAMWRPMPLTRRRAGRYPRRDGRRRAGCVPRRFEQRRPRPGPLAINDRTVHLGGDGLGLSPRAYAALLDRAGERGDVGEDNYLLGGEIRAFEQHWATLLGKETAVFMPSGTLANQLALRALAGTKRRVIVPETSHIYNDTGDACQTLSGLTLMPLASGRGDLHARRRRGRARADGRRPRRHRRRRHR